MSTLRKVYLLIRALPKTVYFNFRYLRFREAVKLPVFVSHHVILQETKGSVVIHAPIKTGMIRIGFGEHVFFNDYALNSCWSVGSKGKVEFNGSALIGNGSRFYVLGTLQFGNNLMISASAKIQCFDNIRFGDDVLIGWDCVFMDTDGHAILNNEQQIINTSKPVVIGNKVWIGAKSSVMKGVTLGSQMVVAANSVVLKSFDLNHIIIGGYPAKLIKENISWQG